MRVSIIVPVYNSEAYLRACLESIEAQSFRDFEVLLVDDGSSDSSGRICDEWGLRDSRFKVIHTANNGVSAARNRGLDSASGDFVYFVDSDDSLVPETLKRLVLAMDGGKYDIAASAYTYIGSGGEREKKLSPESHFSVYGGEEAIRLMLNGGDTIWFTCWNKLINRRLVETLRFKPIAQEDFLFCTELYLNTSEIIFVNESLYRYYDRPGSLSKDVSIIGLHKTVPVLWELYQSVPESRHSLRTLILIKLYRRILSTSYIVKESGITPAELRSHRSLCASIVKESRKAFMSDASIPLKEKLLFITVRALFWRRCK